MIEQGVETGYVSNALIAKRGRLTRWVGYNVTVPVDEEWKRKWTPDKRVYKLKCHWVDKYKD
jgi:hypothetical protein